MTQPAENDAKREAAVQAMIAKGYTRERAEYLLFEVVGKALFGPNGRFADRPIPPAFCLCGYVDDLGDGTCGNCGLRIMTEDDETRPIPPEGGKP